MEFKYQATVIIPVYNAVKTLAATLDSLFKQTINQSAVEILLVDDGSVDGSSALCDEYAKKCNNVFVLHQENKGVSAARNNGIRHAKGRYLFFLDSDDQFSSETIKEVVCFFEEHDAETDVVTYPLTYVYTNGKTNIHWRYQKILQDEKVYSLSEEPNCFLSQTTMNVCVKNDSTTLFDENMKYGEDQLYITGRLVGKNSIGYVQSANYLYYRSSASAASTSGLLMNSLPDVKRLFCGLVALKKKYPDCRKYIDSMMLYNCEWRIKGDYFYPYHLPKAEFEKSIDELRSIFDGIDTSVICNHPQIGINYKFFMLSLKKMARPKVVFEKESIKTIAESTGEICFERNEIDIVINQIKVSNNELYILAFVKFLEYQLTNEKMKLTVVFDENNREIIKLFPSQDSCWGTQMRTNKFNGFIIRKPLNCFKSMRFEVEISGFCYNTKFFYRDKTPINLTLRRNYIKHNEYAILCSKSEIKIVKWNSLQVKKSEARFNAYIGIKFPKYWGIRNLLKLYSCLKKKIWLYMDSHDAVDNGFFQFEHDFPIKDGVERYYIYPLDNSNILSADARNKYGEHLVPFGSFKHKVLTVQAEKVLAAYIGRGSTVPFSRRGEQTYKDLFDYEVIYLQHGVMNAKLPNMYSKEKIHAIDKIVVSTNFEKENLLKLAYEESDILTCGMPRLDYFMDDNTGKKKGRILFAPSWRKRLVTTVKRVQTPTDAFYKSIYFNAYFAFLHDKKLEEFLQQNGLFLDVQMHPMFSCYDDSFEIEKLNRIQKVHFSNPSDYDCCITDFSSILFDYIYLNKPVISYFPDKEEFKGGTHTYREFSFPIDDGFMLVCNNTEEIIKGINELYDNHMKLPDIIQRRAEKLFFNRSSNHRDMIYDALKSQ